ncbi:hypothetical protein PoB_002871500 [Plakobranchus ocellatus]|uniref:Uncharacterized protein n=1 Tax=Plakobranchus ocellatus TaxID=259542 RepID=A0AAV4A480_9GAST|nr:hypothetical protein PoB_002871500 [Plakobranchus ocellatus]
MSDFQYRTNICNQRLTKSLTASLSYSYRRALCLRKPSPPCDSSSTLQSYYLIHVGGRCLYANPVHPAAVPIRYSLSIFFMSLGVVPTQTQSTLGQFQDFLTKGLKT